MIDKAKEVIACLLANPNYLTALRENSSSLLRLLGAGKGSVDIAHTAKRLVESLGAHRGHCTTIRPSQTAGCRRTPDCTLGAVAAVGLTGMMGAIATLGLVGLVALCNDDGDPE